MNFLTAPSSRRPPLLLPFETFSVFGMPNIEKAMDREVNSARCEFANDQSDAHLRRSAAWQCR